MGFELDYIGIILIILGIGSIIAGPVSGYMELLVIGLPLFIIGFFMNIDIKGTFGGKKKKTNYLK